MSPIDVPTIHPQILLTSKHPSLTSNSTLTPLQRSLHVKQDRKEELVIVLTIRGAVVAF